MQSQREEKHLEATLDDLIQKVNHIKASLNSLIVRLEQEYTSLNWPTLLDNFALISGEMNTLVNSLKSDKVPNLHNLVFIPLRLAPEPDPELEKLTEGRVCVFNHDVVPDYLRTKLVPEVEEKVSTVMHRANTLNPDNLNKQINSLNKISSNIVDMIKTKREEWESEMSKSSSLPKTSEPTDTTKLVSAVSFGKSLKPTRRSESSASLSSQMQGHMTQQGVAPGGSVSSHPSQGVYFPSMFGQAGASQGMMNKSQSSVKASIKSAGHTHPYGRP